MYKVIEIGHSPDRREIERKTLYRGESASEAVKTYHHSSTLPFSEKRFYQGAKRLYAYDLSNLLEGVAP